MAAKTSPVDTCRIPRSPGITRTKTESSSGHFLSDPRQFPDAVRSSPTGLAGPFHYWELQRRPSKERLQGHSCTPYSGCPDQSAFGRNGKSPRPSNTSASKDPIRDTDAYNPVHQIGRVPNSLYSQFLRRNLFGRLTPEVCRPKQRGAEGADDVAAD